MPSYEIKVSAADYEARMKAHDENVKEKEQRERENIQFQKDTIKCRENVLQKFRDSYNERVGNGGYHKSFMFNLSDVCKEYSGKSTDVFEKDSNVVIENTRYNIDPVNIFPGMDDMHGPLHYFTFKQSK
ncbi:MAG: hypothetical protein Terrestrivirus13_8 [Terrestrivirus sp.]|uniref:Uncharacterized protein n=1 Tax=Terrestrivirus sp. TaxID=2487775 RepID=A0A3G4ZPB8_9VIRU|nr:MAG: hypothetical protein Terrestrivirus13_8 [Terrestrivirus sp.]